MLSIGGEFSPCCSSRVAFGRGPSYSVVSGIVAAMSKVAWGLMAVLAMLVAGYASTALLIPASRTAFVDALLEERFLRAVGHIGAGAIALAAGAFQFSLRLRLARPLAHRRLGTVYVVAVLLSGVAAALLAPVSDGGPTAHVGFGLLAALWLLTTAAAYREAWAGNYTAHRRWMIRSYALCLAAVTLRIWLPLGLVQGFAFEEIYPLIAWACWVPNLIVAEWLIIPSRWVPIDA